MNHYVIIGGGIAGTSAAEQLRKLDPTSEITILSNEQHPLYSRVLLPHYVLGKVPRERVFLKKLEWYTEQNIHLAFHEVVSIDTNQKQVETASGATYSYDKLLIAGGGTLRKMPFENHEQVYHLQTIEDADRVRKLMDDNEDGALKTGLIGGGFIAMEFAEFFASRNWPVHLFLRDQQFFSRTFDQESSNYLEEHFANHGVTTHKGLTISALEGDIVKTHENGTFTVDALAAGIGIKSDFSWAKDADIDVDRGIKTNEFLETNAPDVYSAGDCAHYMDMNAGRHRSVGTWMNAQMQGRHVAKIMTGDHVPFELVSSYATHVIGIDIIAIGDAERDAADQVVARDYGDGRTLLMIRDNRVVGASIINHNADRAPLTQLIKNRTDISNYLEDLKDTSFDLKTLLA